MKNTIKGNFVGFTNGDPTITNSKDTIKGMTNNKQQSSVEWLEQEMLKPNLSMKEILEQAKEMEKEIMIQFCIDWFISREMNIREYYDKTYGGGNK